MGRNADAAGARGAAWSRWRTRTSGSAMDRWEQRLGGHTVDAGRDPRQAPADRTSTTVLLLHSHLRMTGAWDVRPVGGSLDAFAKHRAWLVLRAGETGGGAVRRAGARADDRRPAALRSAPGVARARRARAASSMRLRYLSRLRATDQTRDDRRGVAEPADPGRDREHLEVRGLLGGRRSIRGGRSARSSDEEAAADRRRWCGRGCSSRARRGRGHPAQLLVYRHTGRPCPRCGTPIASRSQGDDQNRTTYWCPGCQH